MGQSKTVQFFSKYAIFQATNKQVCDIRMTEKKERTEKAKKVEVILSVSFERLIHGYQV